MPPQRLYIFDFDNTLCLWRLGPARRAVYESNLREFLVALNTAGHLLTVASSNAQVVSYLGDMKIRILFHHVIGDPTLEKRDMVLRLCSQYPHVSKNNIMFFDDDDDSVIAVQSLGIQSINVAPFTGISLALMAREIEK